MIVKTCSRVPSIRWFIEYDIRKSYLCKIMRSAHAERPGARCARLEHLVGHAQGYREHRAPARSTVDAEVRTDESRLFMQSDDAIVSLTRDVGVEADTVILDAQFQVRAVDGRQRNHGTGGHGVPLDIAQGLFGHAK